MQLAVRSQRIYALDALRTFLMFFGLLVHAGSHTSVVWGMGAIAFVSGLFRMEGFFVLAGFFAAMILTKNPPSHLPCPQASGNPGAAAGGPADQLVGHRTA